MASENTYNPDGIFFTIKEVAKQVDVVPATIRNWEKAGLIKIRRSPNGYRIFDLQDIEHLKKIKNKSKDENIGINGIRLLFHDEYLDQAEFPMTAPAPPGVSKRLLGKKWKESRLKRGYNLDEVANLVGISKTLDEEVIPYEAVFFELPEDEADWALQTGAVVTITCNGAFTEQEPYFGTLISITGLTTEADNSLVSVVNLWDREEVVKLSSEDAAVIAALFEGGSWREGASDCANDCLLIMDDDEIQYHSDCGTFNDEVNEKSLQLTEKQQVEVNAILEKYIALGMDDIKE